MAISKIILNGVTQIDLTTDTVTSSNDIVAGKYGHLNTGERVFGTGQTGGSSTLTTKTIILNGTYLASDDNADGYSSVIINVPSGGTPSATAHSIVFELETGPDVTITAYYDSTWISDVIRATTPTTYGGVTVESASLDGTAWYTRPTEAWETVWDDIIPFYPEGSEGEVYPYCWVSALADVEITEGSVWRVTYENVEYRLTCKTYTDQYGVRYYIGNAKYAGQPDDGSGVPFYFVNSGYGAWTGGVEGDNVDRQLYFKIERLVTA